MRNQLLVGGTTYDDSHIYGGVTFSQNVNPSVDMQYGTVAVGEISFTLDFRIATGTEVVWKAQMLGDSAFEQMGIFYIADVQKRTNERYAYKAYDVMARLDTDCTSWFKKWLSQKSAAPPFSFSVDDLMSAVTTKYLDQVAPDPNPTPSYYTVANYVYNFTNGNKWTQNAQMGSVIPATDIKVTGITVRDILSQIAAYCGQICYASSGGNVVMTAYLKPRTGASTYADVLVPLTTQKEKTTLSADYDAPKSQILSYNYDGTAYQYDDGTAGEGDEANVYEVPNNWFMNGVANVGTQHIATRLSQMYPTVHHLTDTDGAMYRPVSLRLFTDKGETSSGTARLNVGNVFEYEDGTITPNVATISQWQGLVPGTTPIICFTDYTILPNGVYRAKGAPQNTTLSALQGQTFYTIAETGDVEFYEANAYEGRYLYKTTYYITGVASVTVYRVVSVAKNKHYGVVFRKKITPSGVEIDCTGGKWRQTTSIIEPQ